MDAKSQQKKIEEAQKIVIKLDSTLPNAIQIKIRDRQQHIGQRIKIYGYVHRHRDQGLKFAYIIFV